jgi:hypothetical protein
MWTIDALLTSVSQGAPTVPNILAQFSAPGYPIGFSKGIGKRDVNPTNGLNAAVSGAIVQVNPLL